MNSNLSTKRLIDGFSAPTFKDFVIFIAGEINNTKQKC